MLCNFYIYTFILWSIYYRLLIYLIFSEARRNRERVVIRLRAAVPLFIFDEMWSLIFFLANTSMIA